MLIRTVLPLKFCLLAAFFITGCTKILTKTDYLYVPMSCAYSGIGDIGDAAFIKANNTFSNINDYTTIAFYKGDSSGTEFKRQTSNGLKIFSAKRYDCTKFKANRDGLLLMKAAYTPGFDMTIFSGFTWIEYAKPNNYLKAIDVDLKNIRNGVHNMDFAIVALNVGNNPIKELKIIDVLPDGMEYVKSRFAIKDDFIPLNANLATIDHVEHKIVKDGNNTVLILDCISSSGIEPSSMVEILVNVNIKTDVINSN